MAVNGVNNALLNGLTATDPFLQAEVQNTRFGQTAVASVQQLPTSATILQAALGSEGANIAALFSGLTSTTAAQANGTPSVVQLTNSNTGALIASATSQATTETFRVLVNSMGQAQFLTDSNVAGAPATAAGTLSRATYSLNVSLVSQTTTGNTYTAGSAYPPDAGTGTNLNGANFAGQNNAGVDFSNDSLRNANFGFTFPPFSTANLTGANFQGADLTNASFQFANLTNANLVNAQLSGANFTGATLTGATFGVSGNITINLPHEGTSATVTVAVTSTGSQITPTFSQIATATVNAINGAGLGLTASISGNTVVVTNTSTPGPLGDFTISGADLEGGNLVSQLGLNNAASTAGSATVTSNGSAVAVSNTNTGSIAGGAVNLTFLTSGTATIETYPATGVNATSNGTLLTIGTGNTASLETNNAIGLVLSSPGVSILNAVAPGTNSASTSNASVATGVATTGAAIGGFNLNITSLGTPQRITGTSLAANTATAIASGTLTITINGTGTNVPFTVTSGSTVYDLQSAVATAINNAGLGLNAYIQYSGTNTRLIVDGGTVGTAGAFSIAGADANGTSTVTTLGLGAGNVSTAATNATVTVNGVAVTPAGNTLTLDNGGITAQLLQTGTVTLAVQPATSSSSSSTSSASNTVGGATAFVSAYNNLASFLGSSSLFSTQAATLSAAAQTSATNLASVGITIGANGALVVNETELTSAASSSPSAVQSALSGLASAAATAVSGAQLAIGQVAGESQTATTTALISSGTGSGGIDLRQLAGLGPLLGGGNVNAAV